MRNPADLVEALASDPAGSRQDVLALLADSEAQRSWHAAREAKWVRYLDTLDKDPASPAKDTARELEQKQKVSAGQAKKRAERAEQLGQLPETENALEEGSITDAHADVLARARSKADSKARAALAEKEADLLSHAATESIAEFTKRVERFVQQHAADDGRSQHEKKKAARRLSLWQDRDGMTQLRGSFDPESGQLVKRTLTRVYEQLWRKDNAAHPADEAVPFGQRDNEQRMADALVEVSRRADATDHVQRGADKAIVILSYETLLGQLDDAGISPTLGDGTTIPASMARRLACDAGIIPAVLNGDSVPLDLGRTARVASPAQRAGLGLQWSTCAGPDCTVPFAWTEIHHTTEWNPNQGHGNTDLENLVPGCDHCHDLFHTPGWTVEKHDDGSVTTAGPDGTTWHRHPNGPGVRRTEPPPAAASEPTPSQGASAASLFPNAA